MPELPPESWSGEFPRLLYIADLPVAPTQAGAILLYRLLEQWPADKLLVCTPTALSDCPLEGVRKLQPPKSPFERLFYSRVACEWMTLLTLQSMFLRCARRGRPARWLAGPLEEFAPEAVLTVGLAGAWMEADAVSRTRGIPLHVIIHDDHHYSFFWVPRLRPWGERLFAATYRRAASRLCISRPMERAYRERFGVPGQVLMPCRGRDSVVFPAPRESGFAADGGLRVIYAGSVYGRVFGQLEEIAAALQAKGHRLILYTPSEPPSDFKPVHLEIRRPLASSELVRRLHEEADLLLLLGNFDPSMREISRTQFPSKLVDYTAAAVPILVVAPEDSCVASYIAERPRAATLLCDPSAEAVCAAVDQLSGRRQDLPGLAMGAVEAGLSDFSHDAGWSVFCAAVMDRGWETAATPRPRKGAPVA